MIMCIIVLLLCLAFPTKLYSEEVKPPKHLWKGLIAEAIDERYKGHRPEIMLYIAFTVRNRLEKGMDHGLIGLKRKDLNKFVKDNVRWVKYRDNMDFEKIAKHIIHYVFYENAKDKSNGLLYFEDEVEYGTPYWVYRQEGGYGIVKIKQIGDVVFYTERR